MEVTLPFSETGRKCVYVISSNRVSLGYSMTRALPEEIRTVGLKTLRSGQVEVSFR